MSAFSYNDVLKLFPKAQPRIFPEPQCDPVIKHCIKLRKFQYELENLLSLTTELKEVHDESKRVLILKSLPPVPKMPKLVKKKSPDKKEKSLELGEIEIAEESIVELISKSIASIFFMLGYTDMSSHLLQMLTKIVIDYVKSFIGVMLEFLPEDGFISLDLLEIALQEKGINGIEELYSFYTERVVKFHDRLNLKCRHLCADLKNNLKKPDTPPKKNIAKSSIDEHCSTDINKEQNDEVSAEDSMNFSPDSKMLAKDLFLHKKIRQNSVHFSPQTAVYEISNQKDSFKMKIAANQKKFL